MITLILGAEKSGKSDFALSLLLAAPAPRRFVATGRALDADFAERIDRHQKGRPADLPVVETILDLPETLDFLRPDCAALLADSLDFWLFSCLDAGDWPARAKAFEQVLTGWSGPDLILVAAQAEGLSVADSFSRKYARALGALNQTAARCADRVALVVAGLPLWLKEPVR